MNFFNQQKRKSRKSYECCSCNKSISAGDTYGAFTYKHKRKFCQAELCENCYEALLCLQPDYSGSITELACYCHELLNERIPMEEISLEEVVVRFLKEEEGRKKK